MNALARQELLSLLDGQQALEPGHEQQDLAQFAVELLAWTRRQDLASFKRASGSEELLHPLHVEDVGPAAYLVSDGFASKSQPHWHQTWAVIVGIEGKELNRIFTLASNGQLHVSGEVVVGPGDTLVLDSTSIHSTTVVGKEPSFHIHVYGKALHRLAPFSARTYVAGEV
ncbi:MAG: hypothetical protein U5M53_12080 [Rhodoferax sp.]|nr:hypothetical protein [Rhodoferax sp.]